MYIRTDRHILQWLALSASCSAARIVTKECDNVFTLGSGFMVQALGFP